MPTPRVVQPGHPHRHNRGDRMEQKYAATYRFPGSKAVVHVVAPAPMTEEELSRRKLEFDRACWRLWESLSVDARLKMNLGVDLTKLLQSRLQELRKGELA